MPDLAYIDKYFKKELTREEITEFEKKIVEDPIFAEDVAFYCSTMQVVNDQLAEEKKKQFRKIYDEVKLHSSPKPAVIKRLWIYVAAAAVVAGLIIGWYLFSRPPSIEDLADRYVKQHVVKAEGVKMTSVQDSVDAAVGLYNENKLPQALSLFETIIRSDSTADFPIKMAGIVSLRLRDYDKAIDYFTRLERLTLYSNPGKFYHAIALIKRNRNGDKEIAKQLLKQVVDQDLEGKETAQKWLRYL